MQVKKQSQISLGPRERLSLEAKKVFQRDDRVLVEAATGAGKTKLALELMAEHIKTHGEPWDIIVPNRPLIQGWFDEIAKWKLEKELIPHIRIYCYQSLHKHVSDRHTLTDEAHKVTDLKLKFLKAKLNNKASIALSASVTPEKRELLKQLGFTSKNTVKLSLDEAVHGDIVAPYMIDIIELNLDDTTKNIPGGTKAKPFMTTEKAGYDFVDKKAKQAMMSQNANLIKFATIKRMHYIYNLPSKVVAAKNVLKAIPKDKKVLVMCANIKQADQVCQYRYHSKTDDTDYERFCKGEIMRLSAVQGINEGVNIPELDYILLVQCQSGKIHAIQKIGRLLRKTSDPNKVGRAIILETIGTQDTKWVNKALSSFNRSRINYVAYKSVLKRIGKI